MRTLNKMSLPTVPGEVWAQRTLLLPTSSHLPQPCCPLHRAPEVQPMPRGFLSPFSRKSKKMSLHIIFPFLLTLENFWETPLDVF